jgi:alkylhydroperoxidase/carboxymuconolactone decarboxylase family protein YurZ
MVAENEFLSNLHEPPKEPAYLTDREKQLIGLAVMAARSCVSCSGTRFRRAIDSGIPHDVIIQVIEIASMVDTGCSAPVESKAGGRKFQYSLCSNAECMVS